MSRSLRTPFTRVIEDILDLPYTISYVIRKRIQIDSFNELPKEKRPPLRLIFDAPVEELEEWLESVYNNKHTDMIIIPEDEIE